MKKHFLITFLLIVVFLQAEAQNKMYFGLESGIYFGKANANISSSMAQSGLGDYYISNSSFIDFLLGRGGIDHQTPKERVDKVKYKIRLGYYLTSQIAIEAGFGLTYYGSVSGYDKAPSGTHANQLWIESRINTLYAAIIKNNNTCTAGFGAGPAFSLYKLTTIGSGAEQSKNHLLPGGMITGFWNFLSKKSWFVGLRTEMSLTLPINIDEIKITNPYDASFVSTFKSTKTGSLNGSVTLNAGIRF